MHKILLAEDEPNLRELLALGLTRKGYAVETAANGAEALRKARTSPPDLIVSDVMMPEMDGAELSLEVFSRYPRIKVLCMSGYADKETEIGLVLGPKAEFIQKPFSPDALTRKVWNLLHPGNKERPVCPGAMGHLSGPICPGSGPLVWAPSAG